jgi:hypothetical protein
VGVRGRLRCASLSGQLVLKENTGTTKGGRNTSASQQLTISVNPEVPNQLAGRRSGAQGAQKVWRGLDDPVRSWRVTHSIEMG